MFGIGNNYADHVPKKKNWITGKKPSNQIIEEKLERIEEKLERIACLEEEVDHLMMMTLRDKESNDRVLLGLLAYLKLELKFEVTPAKTEVVFKKIKAGQHNNKGL